MDKIFGVFGSLPESKRRNDDDFADRLLYRHTAGLFILFAIIVSTKQYVGEPIQCWVPAEFTGSHEEYTNNYCWIRNTYFLPYESNIPKEYEPEKRRVIPYYQWMPIILSLQALLCYMPILVWRTFNRKSGVAVDTVIETGESFSNADLAESREKMISFMVRQMDRYLTNQQDLSTSLTISIKNLIARGICCICGRRRGNYLVTLYLFCKFFAFLIVIFQIFALNYFLGQNFYTYGFEALWRIIKGRDEFLSKRFPRVTMCDFKVRKLGNIQRYTVQCVLPINLFNEKIYLFIWFWLGFVSFVLLLSFFNWLIRVYLHSNQTSYVKKHLNLMNKIDLDPDKKQVPRFIHDYLKQDGVFILRLVGHNTNAITVTEFVCELWDNFRSKPMIEKEKMSSLP